MNSATSSDDFQSKALNKKKMDEFINNLQSALWGLQMSLYGATEEEIMKLWKQFKYRLGGKIFNGHSYYQAIKYLGWETLEETIKYGLVRTLRTPKHAVLATQVCLQEMVFHTGAMAVYTAIGAHVEAEEEFANFFEELCAMGADEEEDEPGGSDKIAEAFDEVVPADQDETIMEMMLKFDETGLLEEFAWLQLEPEERNLLRGTA